MPRTRLTHAARHTVSLRATPALMSRLDALIAFSGRSLAQEVEFQLERALMLDDMRQIIREEVSRAAEVTQPMIDAAVLELSGYNLDYCSIEEAAERIVRAALEATEGGDRE